jgi:hypothetical protein
MKHIDMSPYTPFRTMGKTCNTRQISDKKIVWPRFELESFQADQYRVRLIKRTDIESVAEIWRTSYPELYGNEYGFVFYPEKIEQMVALYDNWESDKIDKHYCMIVTEEKATSKIACVSLYKKYDLNLQVELSLTGTHPDYRGKKLTAGNYVAFHRKIKESGAEYLTTFLETWHDITQQATCNTSGWKLAGIFPGNVTRWNGGQEEYRGCLVYMYKFLNEEYNTRAEEWTMAPVVQELWDVLEKLNKKINPTE